MFMRCTIFSLMISAGFLLFGFDSAVREYRGWVSAQAEGGLMTPAKYLEGIPSIYRRLMQELLDSPKCFRTKQERFVCINVGRPSSLVLAGTAKKLYLRCSSGLSYSGSRAHGLEFIKGSFADPRYVGRAGRSFSYVPGKKFELRCGGRKLILEGVSTDVGRRLILGAKLEIPPPERSVFGVYRRKKGEIIYVEKAQNICAGNDYRVAMGRPPELRWQKVTKTGQLLDGGSVSIGLSKGRHLFIPFSMTTSPGSKEPAVFRLGPKGGEEKLEEIRGRRLIKLGIRVPGFPEKHKSQNSVCMILGH